MIAGLLDQHSEFFTINVLHFYAQAGVVSQSEKLPSHFTQLLAKELFSQPKAVDKLLKMGFTTKEAMVAKYYDCNYSEADEHPDLTQCGKLGPREFKQCASRGNCVGENVICCNPFLLTIKEVQVLKYIGLGLLDKEIRDALNISQDTLRSHKDSISLKTNCSRKAQLSVIAHQIKLV